MVEVLYIKASPREDRSYSTKVAESFLDVYRIKNPGHRIRELDLFKTDLPDFAFEAISARYLAARAFDMSAAQRAAWDQVKEIAASFAQADKYVFSVPMWNYFLPWRLKLYIDLLVQPGITFKVVEGGYAGLLTGKSAFLICSSGNEYPPGAALEARDFQKAYLEFILKYIGIDPVTTLSVAPTLAKGPETAAAVLDNAMAQAAVLAEKF